MFLLVEALDGDEDSLNELYGVQLDQNNDFQENVTLNNDTSVDVDIPDEVQASQCSKEMKLE